MKECGENPRSFFFWKEKRRILDKCRKLSYNFLAWMEEKAVRMMEFKMERHGLLEVGQEVEVTESALPTSYYYTIIPAVAMSKNYGPHERLKARTGIVREINVTDRGYYTMVEFDEEEV